MKKIIISIVLAIILILAVALPVFAISNPTAINWYTPSGTSTMWAKGFTNVYTTGDMLFVTETYIHYSTPPTDYQCSQAFSFEVMNTAGTSVITSTPVPNYECKVVGIYLTPALVTSYGITSGTDYKLRLTGNPAIFGSLVEGTNMVTTTMSSGDWYDESVGKGTVTDMLAFWAIKTAQDMQANDGVTTDGVGGYLNNVQGNLLITTIGASIFLAGINNLNVYIPQAFQTTSSVNSYGNVPTTGAYQTTLTNNMASNVGTTTASALNGLGNIMGMPATSGSTFIWALLSLIVGFWAGHRWGGLAGAVCMSMCVAIGSVLGVIMIAWLFALIVLVALLAAWFFYSRGYI